ncbi:MAG: M28 family peptidase [Planctomycetota bacterium]
MSNIVFDGQNAFNLLKRLSFPRLGGTPEEKKAANLLKQYLRSIGLKPKEETFRIQTYKDINASLEVLTPYRKKYEAAVIGNSGSTPGKGITAEVVHITSSEPSHLKTARNKIVLTYNVITKSMHQQLRQYKTKAIIRVQNPAPRCPAGSGRSASESIGAPALMQLKQNELFIKAYGRIPSIMLNYEDGLEMVHKSARTVRVVLKQKEFQATSRNVIATIPGTELPNEKIIICGHYDSVNKCPGTVDNGGGSVSIAEFARHFARNPAKRTLIFIWFGSEEMGLKGSWAYTKQHARELAKPRPPISLKTKTVKLVINFDVAGTTFGNNGTVICGHESMSNFVDSFTREKGLPVTTHHSAYSSDNIPFNERGIPSIALHRYSGVYGHTKLDGIYLASPEGLKVMGQFGLELVDRIANAVEIPFELSIPEADKKFTYEYVERADPFYKRP